MTDNILAATKAVWFLVGPFDSAETTRYMPIYTLPFVVGRREDAALSLNCKTVSAQHAEITEAGGSLVLRDLGSTNGTYVNGRRIAEPVGLQPDDIVQFANLAFRVRRQSAREGQRTVTESSCDRALALAQFDRLMADHAVTPRSSADRVDGEPGNRGLRGPGPQPAVRAGDAQGHVPGRRPAQPGSRAQHDAALGRRPGLLKAGLVAALVRQHSPPRARRAGPLAFAGNAADEFSRSAS